ncbi:hypothetical protein FACS1894167_04190 [Synergistales bacterium]|nr:hypothetical protein FACS1894167_04190 [Synergistales bacterium]
MDKALQNPSAPSPVANFGPLCKPRLRRFVISAYQLSQDSLYPSSTAISSFAPSSAAPIITRWEQVYEVYGSLFDQELQFRAKEWRTLFEIGTGVRKLSRDDVPGYLAVYFERQNSSHGFGDYIPEPIDVMAGETLNREELTGGTDKNPMLKFVKGLRNEEG